MASLIKDYTYDVFISYRQKDNKYDGWVSTFVENLKLELEATFKEDVSVYFDLNPLDGLLESNEVTESLKNKLKSVIFIPVLSQTYCDPKSFAFENEFKEFVKQAAQEDFGLKISLYNGNISSRVLPVRINELNTNDTKLVESIVGGPLRGIDFIYRSQGVNRPLRQIEDHPQDNLNKTYYRDQINKVAHSIKDIILSIKGDLKYDVIQNQAAENKRQASIQSKNLAKPVILVLTILALISILFFFSFKPDSSEILNKAISHNDFYGRWENFEGKLHLITLFANGVLSEEIIEIKIKENYYKCIGFNNTSTDTVASGIVDGKYFRQVNQSSAPVSDSLNIDRFKNHHSWHFGGIMFLKKSGMKLNKKAIKTKFFGNKSLMLTFTSDSSNTSNVYLNNSIWKVYIDANNYSVLGYSIKGGFYKNENIVVCQGELDYNGIKVPMFKFYYNDANNIMLVDLFHKDVEKPN